MSEYGKYKEYHKRYREEHKEELKEYHKRYRENNRKKLRVKGAKHYEKNKKQMLEKAKKRYQKFRLKVLNIVSGNNLFCVRCGCNDIRLLEINHINGRGREETGGKFNTGFYKKIVSGNRKTDDLELLCKVCNAWHYLELKYGKLPYEITYKGGE